MLFKKKLSCADDEDDDYEYIGDDNGKKPKITCASIKSDCLFSGLSTNDKKVRYRSIFVVWYYLVVGLH